MSKIVIEELDLPEDLHYTKEHEWIRVEGNIGTVGLTDYASKSLPDITYLDISASIGDDFSKGDTFGEVETVKATEEIFLPVAGKVMEINEILTDEDKPETINKDPYGDGWLIKIELNNVSELEQLLDAASYRTHCEEEEGH